MPVLMPNVMATKDQSKHASLVEKISGVDLACDVDHFRLDQVFRNLFENSLTACPNPARIEVFCSETEINGQPGVHVAVRDNGPGLTFERKTYSIHFTQPSKRAPVLEWPSRRESSMLMVGTLSRTLDLHQVPSSSLLCREKEWGKVSGFAGLTRNTHVP